MTDARRAILGPPIPVHRPGRPRDVEIREVLDTISYQARSGCRWDMLPHDLPPKSTVHDHFSRWRDDGTWQGTLDALRQEVRVAAGPEPSPGAGSIDGRTAEGAEVGGERGHDGGKELSGRRRHIVVDVLGLPLAVVVTAASDDDGTGAPSVLGRPTAEHRGRLKKARADEEYRNHAPGRRMRRARAEYEVEVVRSRGRCRRFPGRWG